MPLYDYRCRDCDDRFEVRLGLDEKTAVACPAGHTNTVRLFSPVAITGRSSPSPSVSVPPAAPCGSACGCHHS